MSGGGAGGDDPPNRPFGYRGAAPSLPKSALPSSSSLGFWGRSRKALCEARDRVLTNHTSFLPFAVCQALGNLLDLRFPDCKMGLQHSFFGSS